MKVMRIIGIAFLVLLCVLVIALVGAKLYVRQGRGPVEIVDVAGKAFVEEVDGTKVVHLSGTTYELGYQHGSLFAAEIRTTLSQLEGALDELQGEIGVPGTAVTYFLDLLYGNLFHFLSKF